MSLATFTAPKEGGSDKELYLFLRTLARRIVAGQFTWDPPSCAANTTTDTTLTATTNATTGIIANCKPGMAVSVTSQSTLNAGLSVGGAWCATDGQLTIRLANNTAAPIDPSSGTWSFFGVVP